MHKKTLYSLIIIGGFILGWIFTIVINVRIISLYNYEVYNSTTISLLTIRGFLEYLFRKDLWLVQHLHAHTINENDRRTILRSIEITKSL